MHGHVASFIVHAVVKGIIYDIVFKVLRHVGLPETLVIGAVAIFLFWLWNRARPGRRLIRGR